MEAADRLAIRELFDACAHCADRRDSEGQKALFTVDTRFAVYMDGEGSEVTYVLEGREPVRQARRCVVLPRAQPDTGLERDAPVHSVADGLCSMSGAAQPRIHQLTGRLHA